jgi:predicted SAM-dependent methyltransferase
MRLRIANRERGFRQPTQAMLRECFRVLKRGGRIRVATPDLCVLLGLYLKEKTDLQRHYINWAIVNFMPEIETCKDVFVINNFFRARIEERTLL